MYDWYKRGFGTNIAISIIGIFVAAFQFFLYTINRRAYFKLGERLNELKNMQIPQNIGGNISHANSKTSIYKLVPIEAPVDAKRIPLKVPIRNFYNINDDNDDNESGEDDNVNRNANRANEQDVKDGRVDEKEWMF